MPKQVGKIGTESPTFVQPITERKDGIAAMFVKQVQTKTSTTRPRAGKRKGSPVDKEGQEVKKAKVDIFDVETWEDNSIVEKPIKDTNVSFCLHLCFAS